MGLAAMRWHYGTPGTNGHGCGLYRSQSFVFGSDRNSILILTIMVFDLVSECFQAFVETADHFKDLGGLLVQGVYFLAAPIQALFYLNML